MQQRRPDLMALTARDDPHPTKPAAGARWVKVSEQMRGHGGGAALALLARGRWVIDGANRYVANSAAGVNDDSGNLVRLFRANLVPSSASQP